jgi:signal peptidase I
MRKALAIAIGVGFLGWLLTGLALTGTVLPTYFAPSGSMEQTIQVGDRMAVNRLDHSYRRGDIIVFRGDRTDVRDFVGRPGLKYVKRVIAVGGDTVQCCDPDGRVMVNGRGIAESYVLENSQDAFGPVQVPKGRLFVMGDHRAASVDSRNYGPIRASAGVGTIMHIGGLGARLFPWLLAFPLALSMTTLATGSWILVRRP